MFYNLFHKYSRGCLMHLIKLCFILFIKILCNAHLFKVFGLKFYVQETQVHSLAGQLNKKCVVC